MLERNTVFHVFYECRCVVYSGVKCLPLVPRQMARAVAQKSRESCSNSNSVSFLHTCTRIVTIPKSVQQTDSLDGIFASCRSFRWKYESRMEPYVRTASALMDKVPSLTHDRVCLNDA